MTPDRALGRVVVGLAVLLVVAVSGCSPGGPSSGAGTASAAKRCGVQPAREASLLSNDVTTQIRLASADLSAVDVLREEPADSLPGMFGALLAVTPEADRLAYVTATDEQMDGAQLWAIDTANPAMATLMAKVDSGFWPARPAWSPDKTRLAYITSDAGSDATGADVAAFHLWVADGSTQPATVTKVSDLDPEDFRHGHQSALCWAGTRPGLVDALTGLSPAARTPLPSAAPSATPTPSPSPNVAGTGCGVPVYSQNDPTWRHKVMQSGGDLLGGYGCAITSTTMLLNYYGATLSPQELNACLGVYADPLFWSRAPTCAGGAISGGDQVAFSWPAVDAILAAGQPAIVGLLRGQTGTHFVVVTRGGGGHAEDYQITDPWDGTTSKTLATYELSGYFPRWIVTYSGPGHVCQRTVDNHRPTVVDIPDGGASNGQANVKAGGDTTVEVVNVTPEGGAGGGQGKPSPSPSVKIPFPHRLPRVKVSPPGTVISDEGIYQVIAHRRLAGGRTQTTVSMFTIDRTPPSVLINLLSAIQAQAARPRSDGTWLAAALSPQPFAALPKVATPARFRFNAGDTLSGLEEVQFQLDGGPWTPSTNVTSFRSVLQVAALGDHNLSARARDLAGNTSDPVSIAFTVFDPNAPAPTPTPTPTPRPTPKPTPTPPFALAFNGGSGWINTPGITFIPAYDVFTLTNTGGVPAHLGAASLSATDPFGYGLILMVIGQDLCSGKTIGPGATCTIQVVRTQASYQFPSGSGVLTIKATDDFGRSLAPSVTAKYP